MRPRFLTRTLAVLTLLTACTDPADTGAEDLNDRQLGADASPACRAAMRGAADFLAATAEDDATAAAAAYAGDLRAYVRTLDAAATRSDDVAITEALASADGEGAALAEGRLLTALSLELRARLASVETGAEDKFAAWDEGHCLWDGALRGLARRVDTTAGDTIEADIDAAFAAGHDAISGAPPATTVDDWRTPPMRQVIEKTLLRAVHRRLLALASAARSAADPLAATRALGLFGALEDRLKDRNTPGIADITAMLSGDPAAIDPDALRVELDLAFAKRTRKYCDEAFEGGLGVPTSYKGAVEGRTYARLLAVGMARAGQDVEAYLRDWDDYAVHVQTGADLEAAQRVSDRLIAATCAYQSALGVAACTSSEDEVAP